MTNNSQEQRQEDEALLELRKEIQKCPNCLHPAMKPEDYCPEHQEMYREITECVIQDGKRRLTGATSLKLMSAGPYLIYKFLKFISHNIFYNWQRE